MSKNKPLPKGTLEKDGIPQPFYISFLTKALQLQPNAIYSGFSEDTAKAVYKSMKNAEVKEWDYIFQNHWNNHKTLLFHLNDTFPDWGRKGMSEFKTNLLKVLTKN